MFYSRLNKVILLIVLNIANTFFLTVFVIELFYWYKYTIKLPRNDGPMATVTWGHKVEYNRWGFRERDFSRLTFNKQDFLIFVLGDSLTWGTGLSEEQRYSNRLEQYLRKAYPDKKIVVLNFGMSGGATTHQRNLLRIIYREIRVKPNLIVVGFCLNDLQEKGQNYSKEREAYFSKIEPVLFFLRVIEMKGSCQIISRLFENILIVSKRIPNWMDALDRVYRKDSLEWKRFEKALRDICYMSKKITSNPPIFISLNQGVFINKPTDYNKPDDILMNYFLRWHHQAESAARKQGFFAVNCEEEFKKEDSLRNHIMAVMPGEDIHPTAEMNQIYARKLFSVIELEENNNDGLELKFRN